MIKGLIFDLDQTLVDSSIALEARRRRDWSTVYSIIPQFKVYDGVKDALSIARSKGLKIAIVSSAPRSYVVKVLSYHNIPYDVIVGYHDASAPKPSGEPVLQALRQMSLNPYEVISFGDKACDMTSSRSVGVDFVACLWDPQAFADRYQMRSASRVLNNSTSLRDCISMV